MFANFTTALMNAKRASLLRGIPFGNRDVLNLRSGYMEGAAERVAAERSSKLAEDTLAANKENWANTLAQEKELAAAQNALTRETTGAQIDATNTAARKALYGNIATTGVSLGGMYYLTRPELSPDALAITRDMLENKARNDALTGGSFLTGKNPITGVSPMEAAGYYAGARLVKPVTEGVKEIPAGLKTAAETGLKYSAVLGPSVGMPIGAAQGVLQEAGINEAEKIAEPVKFVESAVESAWDAIAPDCIIMTACTNRHSPEVEIAREFRDKFLDVDHLRGYYALAEKIVPLLKENEKARLFVKKCLIDRLIDYGGVALGRKQKTSLRSSWLVSRLFLMLCRAIGWVLPQYVRRNGEVF
jgi:hypothetical protein